MLVPMKSIYDNSIQMLKTCLYYYKIGQLLWYLSALSDHMVKILKLQFAINYHPLHEHLCVSDAYFFSSLWYILRKYDG